MAKCKCKKGVHGQGVGSTVGGVDMESLLFLGAGAIGSMALTNPLESALYKGKVPPIWFSPLAKFGMAYAALMYSDSDEVQAAGIGAAAVGFVELAKAYFPAVLGRSIPGANATPECTDERKEQGLCGYGVGEIIDLNSSVWDYPSYENAESKREDDAFVL